jgi:hypothetical protein
MRSSFRIAIILQLIWSVNFLSLQGQALIVPDNFPRFKVTANNSPDDGYFFLAAVQMPSKQPGYLIMVDNYGTPVYYRYFNKVLNSFGVQSNGLLSFMGRSASGAMFYIMDSTFTIIDSVKTKAPYPKTDPHDFLALRNGHFVFLANDARTMDMSAYGGKTNATVTGCVIQEQDENKNVVFNWNTWDHFQIEDSYADLTVSQVDLIHHNSIEVDEEGNFFLISRSLNEVTKIDRLTGNIIWRLGGKNNQFTFTDPTSIFSMPHDFRKLPDGNFTIFDNGNERDPAYSRALEYSIDQTGKVVDLVWSFDADKKIYADNSGSTTKLQTGNTVIGYGYNVSNPAILEVHPDRSIAFRLELPDSTTSYRAFKSPWKNTLFVPITDSIDFGQWDGYTTSSYLLPVYNKSDQPLTLTSYSVHTSAFTIEESFPITIPANGQVTLTVNFYPGSINTGLINDVLTINSDINTTSLVQRVARQIKLSGTKTDGTAPVATIPLADKKNVPRDTVIYINFSEQVRNPDNSEFTYLNVDPIVVLKKDNANGENVSFDAVINTDRNMITITPDSQLAHTQTYYVAITNGFEDYSDNNGTATSAIFTTTDLTGPTVTIIPANDAKYILPTAPVYIQFDEPVRNPDNSELSNSNLASHVTLRTGNENGNDVPFTATINAEKTIITIVSDQLLTNTIYYVAIGADLEDYNNNTSAPASSSFTTGGSTGLEDNRINPIQVYPNPGNGIFTLKFSDQVKKRIKVTDLSGRIVFEKNNISDESFQLNLSTHTDGLYFLYIVESESGTIKTFKLIKQNDGK